jgi:AcrR family transcriptional regulator
VEGAAARAQTGKQVLYRRWPSRPDLVLAAMRHRGGSIPDQPPDTGTLRGDAVAVLAHMARRQHDLGTGVIRGLVMEAADLDPGTMTRMTGIATTILDRARRRGEIGTGPIPPLAVGAATDLLRYRLFVSAQEVTDQTVDGLVDEVFLPLIRVHAGEPKA